MMFFLLLCCPHHEDSGSQMSIILTAPPIATPTCNASGKNWYEQKKTNNTKSIFFCLDAAWVSPGQSALQSAKQQWRETLTAIISHFLATNKLNMRGPSAQSREDERARKHNGGRGSPGNTLDRRQKGESPLRNTLGRRREEKEEGGMKGIGVKFQLQKDDFCDGQI